MSLAISLHEMHIGIEFAAICLALPVLGRSSADLQMGFRILQDVFHVVDTISLNAKPERGAARDLMLRHLLKHAAQESSRKLAVGQMDLSETTPQATLLVTEKVHQGLRSTDSGILEKFDPPRSDFLASQESYEVFDTDIRDFVLGEVKIVQGVL